MSQSLGRGFECWKVKSGSDDTNARDTRGLRQLLLCPTFLQAQVPDPATQGEKEFFEDRLGTIRTQNPKRSFQTVDDIAGNYAGAFEILGGRPVDDRVSAQNNPRRAGKPG